MVTEVVAVKKPFLKLKQRMNRIRWAEEHKDWEAHKWSSAVFSDECIIQYLSCTRKTFVRRLSTEKYYTPCIQSVIRHGSKIHILGCFSSNGLLKRVISSMNAKKYQKDIINDIVTLDECLIFSRKEFIFQQDLAFPHRATSTRKFLERKMLKFWDGPVTHLI